MQKYFAELQLCSKDRNILFELFWDPCGFQKRLFDGNIITMILPQKHKRKEVKFHVLQFRHISDKKGHGIPLQKS